MGTSRRRHKRFVIESMNMHAESLLGTEIEILDMSSGGACIKTNKSLKVDGKYIIKIDKEGVPLSVKCTVIWENISGSFQDTDGKFKPAYIAGIEFQDIFSDKLVELMDFVGDVGLMEEQLMRFEKRLSGVRFKVHTDAKVVLGYQKKHVIKNISLGGLLLESPQALNPGRKYSMNVFLPGEKLPIRFKGRVVSCMEIPDKRPKRFHIGIDILNMEDNDKARLDTFIHYLKET